MGKQIFNIKGMMRDLDPAKTPNQYAYEIRNLRLTAQEDTTMLALVSEKGNKKYILLDEDTQGNVGSLIGNIIGYCVVGNKYLVVFTHDANSGDSIYRLQDIGNDTMLCKCIYGLDYGQIQDLGFTYDTNIEAIGVYENEDVQRVYWIDGVRQPRVINIVADNNTMDKWDSMQSVCPFDFMMEMQLRELVTISHNANLFGIFPTGTIQYILSYNTKNGQRTPAFYTSSLYYTSINNRGGSPEDTCSGAFEITVRTPDTNFDYVTIYSVVRTSLNGTPICKKVVTLNMSEFNGNITYIDNGLSSESVDYSEILYLGGSNIVPYTMEQKNNTLFFGNIKYNDFIIEPSDMQTISEGCGIYFSKTNSSGVKLAEVDNTFYPYASQVCPPTQQIPGGTYITPSGCASYITTFKFGESYYFGIIAQNKYGQWSNVVPLNIDERRINNLAPNYPTDKSFFQPVIVEIYFTPGVIQLLQYLGCKKLKVVRLDEIPQVACQGVVCPTVFNKDRVNSNGLNYAQSSWYFRPIRKDEKNYIEDNKVQYYHNKNLRLIPEVNCNEVQGSSETELSFDTAPIISLHDTDIFVDWNILTLHSPDIEFGDQSIFGQEDRIRIAGIVPIEYGITSMFIDLDTPAHSEMGRYEPIDKIKINYDLNDAPVCLSDFYYIDDIYDDTGGSFDWGNHLEYYMIFPWHRSTSLTSQLTPDTDNEWYGKLKSKCMATLRSSYRPIYIENWQNFFINITKFKCCTEPNNVVQIESDTNYTGNPRIYHSNVDTILENDIHNYGKTNSTDPVVSLSHENSFVRMNYKSTSHGVFALKYSPNKMQLVLPNTTDIQGSGRSRDVTFPQNFTAKAIIGDLNDSSSTNIHYAGLVEGGANRCYVVRKTFANTYITDGINEGDVILFKNPNSLESLSYPYNKGYRLFHPSSSQPTYNTYPESDWYWLAELSTNFVDQYHAYDYTPDSSVQYQEHYYVYLYISESDADLTLYNYYQQECILIYEFNITRTPGYIVYPSELTLIKTESWSSEETFTEIPGLVFPQWVEDMNHNMDYMYLVDLIKPDRPELTTFAGTNWIVAGLAKDVPSNDKTPLIGDIGDAYFQRYDCLKTYPYSPEAQNQIVEILSFMCETRVNIEGRYDLRRGMTDNTTQNNTNFNKINMAYSQQDNFYSPIYIDLETPSITYHPNQIVWSKTKIYGSKIDTWTNIVSTSSLDLDGNLGEIRALRLWNNNLICFQDMGIAKIMYNERTTISTQQGVPIEIANSGKVDGSQYISNSIGCKNKKSIQLTQEGIYFADSNTREIYKWSKGLDSLSKGKGFNSYFYDKEVNFDKLKSFYDSKLKDVYFRITKDNTRWEKVECLVYNEQLNEFTSFFDYNMDFMFQYNDSLVSVEHNSSNLWKQFAGDEYLRYFGETHNDEPVYKNYSVELISSENPTVTKIFTDVEFRADVLRGSITTMSQSTESNASLQNLASINKLPFKTIRVWNEYQDTGNSNFQRLVRKGANLSQKFRIWRASIDRDHNEKLHHFNRITSPWARFRLTGGGEDIRTVVHDIGVMYV